MSGVSGKPWMIKYHYKVFVGQRAVGGLRKPCLLAPESHVAQNTVPGIVLSAFHHVS